VSKKSVELPRIRLWEQAALRPGESSPFVWPGRSATELSEPAENPRQALERARREYRRSKAATIRGLLLSMVFCMPVGGAYALSSPLIDGIGGPEQCQSLSSMLGPKQQRRLREYRASHGLTSGQESALRLKVCDAGLLGAIPSLTAMITNAQEFEAMARRLEGMGGEISTGSLVKLFLSGEGGAQ